MLLLPLLLLGGCSGVPPRPDDPNALLLRFSAGPSLVGYSDFAAIPEFSLYGGGRVIRPGRQVGAMFTAEEIHIGPEAAEDLYGAAHGLGFDRDSRYSNPDVIDGGVLVVTLNSGGRRYTTTAANPPEIDFRFHGLLGIERLVAPGNWPGAGAVYRPGKVFALGWTGGKTESWAPALPFQWKERSRSGMCVILDRAVAEELSGRSQWVGDGYAWHVFFRPVLPDESSCADL